MQMHFLFIGGTQRTEQKGMEVKDGCLLSHLHQLGGLGCQRKSAFESLHASSLYDITSLIYCPIDR